MNTKIRLLRQVFLQEKMFAKKNVYSFIIIDNWDNLQLNFDFSKNLYGGKLYLTENIYEPQSFNYGKCIFKLS